MDYLTSFFNQGIFIIYGGISICITLLSILYVFICWAIGISPVLIRLGLGLWQREIAIISNANAFSELKGILSYTKIFKNIVHINPKNHEESKDKNLVIVDWESANKYVSEVIGERTSINTPIIIFAKPATIPNEIMSVIANKPNIVVVNFKGRLLNDVLTCLITSSYKK